MFFTLHIHIVKLVTALNFTRILSTENVSPDSSCSCCTLVLCTTMLKSFSRPSFLDCTRGSVKPLGESHEGVGRKKRHAIAKCSDSPHLLEKKWEAFVFLSGAAIGSRLIDLSFAVIHFSACACMYTYIYNWVYIYIIYIYTYLRLSCFWVCTLVFTSVFNA